MMAKESGSEISQSFCEQIIKQYDKNDLERPAYVIQKHDASKIHWDLRFELDGILKSWALPKEPPRKAGDKRLAVEVVDHPLEYAMFEGRIPEGNYGAGTVKIWDSGTFELVEQQKKKLVVDIGGNKLKGKYCLLHFRPAEKNWLFFKMK